MRRILLSAFICFLPLVAFAGIVETSAGTVTITKIVGDLKEPWGLAFLPNDEFLVTERGGRLLLVNNSGVRNVVTGVPRVQVKGQGGLLDVVVARDFSSSREIFISYAKRLHGGSGTALAVAKLSIDNKHMINLRVIFEMRTNSNTGRHFGGRIVEATDSSIFLTIGERGRRNEAQNLTLHNGSAVHILRDGRVPNNNPFIGQSGALPEIWSYGHRNPQGAALDKWGDLWVNEHGAKGGDEINRIEAGKNYGWPVIAYGRHYSGSKIGIGTQNPGMEQPKHFWNPSIAPSGLMIYSGKLWPEWRGHFFVGSLKFNYLGRLDPRAAWNEERISSPQTRRVRDVREAPDGSIWFLSVGERAVFRMSPK